jgi:hypothetical protein
VETNAALRRLAVAVALLVLLFVAWTVITATEDAMEGVERDLERREAGSTPSATG